MSSVLMTYTQTISPNRKDVLQGGLCRKRNTIISAYRAFVVETARIDPDKVDANCRDEN